MAENIFVSAVICTHRRPENLKLLLESLVHQVWRDTGWEILVVENDTLPSDEVKAVVESFSDQLPIRALFDSVPNLSRARNIGIKEARGEYVAYLDDDCVTEPGWLKALVDGCRQYNPDFCAGPIYPLFCHKKPDWYLEEWGYHSYFGDKTMRTDGVPAGGNFVGRRSLMRDLGGFQESVGMSGNKIAYGEETGLITRAKAANPNLCVMYLFGLAARHEVFPYKMRIGWHIRSTWAMKRDCCAIGTCSMPGSWAGILKTIILALYGIITRGTLACLIAVADVFCSNKIYWRRFVVKSVSPEVGKLSVGYYALALHLKDASNRVMRNHMINIVKPLLRPFVHRLRIAKKRSNIHNLAKAGNSRVILGCGQTSFPGWIATDIDILNILSADDWQRCFNRDSIGILLAEHVWEHFTADEAVTAARNCYEYLKPGGWIRAAVPDGYNPSKKYIEWVRVGGTGDGSDDHKVLYNFKTFAEVFESVGFKIENLEYYDEDGVFRHTQWEPEDGFISRSYRNDHTTRVGLDTCYTSLIVDAVKPVQP